MSKKSFNKVCADCGTEFKAPHHSYKYCDKCRKDKKYVRDTKDLNKHSGNYYSKGKKILLNDEVIKALVKRVEKGHSEAAAMRQIGLKPTSLGNWKRKGREEDPEPIYKKLVDELEQARFKLLDMAVKGLYDLAAKGDFRAINKILNSEDPTRWNKKQPSSTEINASQIKKVEVNQIASRDIFSEMKEEMDKEAEDYFNELESNKEGQSSTEHNSTEKSVHSD